MGKLAGRGGHGRENVDYARELIGRLAGAGPRDLVSELDPEIELLTVAPLPGAGRFHGQPGFLRWLERWEGAWQRESLWVAMVEPIGTRRVVATVSMQAKDAVEQGQSGEPAMALMVEFGGAGVTRLHAYPDRRSALLAAREKPSPS